MSRRIPSKGKYLIELDGITQLRASKITGPGLEHEPGTIYEGNKNTPTLVPGTFKPTEVTVTHAHAVGENAASQVSDWIQAYKDGLDLEPRTMRVITLDPAGFSPVFTSEYIGCVPKSFKQEDYDAASNEGAQFSFSVMAEDMITI
jgi:phage tail-like protein